MKVVLSVLFTILAVPAFAAKPNIILCMADDLGWGDVGFNGNETDITPELDRMAIRSSSGVMSVSLPLNPTSPQPKSSAMQRIIFGFAANAGTARIVNKTDRTTFIPSLFDN